MFASQRPLKFSNDCSQRKEVNYSVVNEKIFQLFQELYEIKKINILLRIHPNENIKDYQSFLKEYPFIQIINDKFSLIESLAVSDYVLTAYSTVALESIASGKEVFTFKYDFNDCYPVKDFMNKPFIYANSYKKLRENLFSYIKKNKKNEELDNYIPLNAKNDIVRLLKELTK